MEFSDITTEEYREYIYPDGNIIKVKGNRLNVSKSGGHRIEGADGLSYYIPSGWLYLRWKVEEGQPLFSF